MKLHMHVYTFFILDLGLYHVGKDAIQRFVILRFTSLLFAISPMCVTTCLCSLALNCRNRPEKYNAPITDHLWQRPVISSINMLFSLVKWYENVIFLYFASIYPFWLTILNTIYPKKYAHGFCFAVLCCDYTLTDFPISIRLTSLALWQSNDCPSASKATLMNMDKYFMWIHYER